MYARPSEWNERYREHRCSVDAAKIILGETGARCQRIEKQEVEVNQPQEAACEGCGGGGWEYCLGQCAPDAALRKYMYARPSEWNERYREHRCSVDAAKIILGETGARCQRIEKQEVKVNQPQEAACEGCGGGGWEYCLGQCAPDAALRKYMYARPSEWNERLREHGCSVDAAELLSASTHTLHRIDFVGDG